MSTQRPKFLPSFIDLLREEAEQVGIRALVPFALITCGLVGAAAMLLVPSQFWAPEQMSSAIAVYAAATTFCGLILALGWNAFSRMYEILFRGAFAAYLLKNKLLNQYLVHIGFMNFCLLAATAVSGMGLVTVLWAGLPLAAERAIFGLSIALIIYAVKQTASAVSAMNDLVWQSAVFETHQASERDQENSKVTRLGRVQ